MSFPLFESFFFVFFDHCGNCLVVKLISSVYLPSFSKLFVWFIAVISLCGISLLANLILTYLACNQASRSAVWTRRMGERQLLFSDDDNEL